jgi:phosphoglucosamine mutase
LVLREKGIAFKRANVGDRYVMAELDAAGWLLGGEASGHILCLDKSTTGDALIAGLQVLAAVIEQGKTLAELTQPLKVFPQVLVNVRLAEMRDPFADDVLCDAFAKAEETLAGRGRLLIRKSGTEPMIRVMVEGENKEQVTKLANDLANLVRTRLSA